jgi:hypothetical protein
MLRIAHQACGVLEGAPAGPTQVIKHSRQLLGLAQYVFEETRHGKTNLILETVRRVAQFLVPLFQAMELAFRRHLSLWGSIRFGVSVRAVAERTTQAREAVTASSFAQVSEKSISEIDFI